MLERLFYILVLPPFESIEGARATIKEEIEQDPSLKDYLDPLIDRIERDVHNECALKYNIDSQVLSDNDSL